MNQSHQQLSQLSPEKRLKYLVKQARNADSLWILTDEHGCVMLNAEDEDCVPVWPSETDALQWATGEWSHCKPLQISLTTWYERWTTGLQEDDVMIAVFPNQDEEGLVLFADEFEQELKQADK